MAVRAVVESRSRYRLPWFNAKGSANAAAQPPAKAPKAPVKATTTTPGKRDAHSASSRSLDQSGCATPSQATEAGWRSQSLDHITYAECRYSLGMRPRPYGLFWK
jgi:hypothetical protein